MIFHIPIFAMLGAVVSADAVHQLRCSCEGGGYVLQATYYPHETQNVSLTIRDYCISSDTVTCSQKSTFNKIYAVRAHGHWFLWKHSQKGTTEYLFDDRQTILYHYMVSDGSLEEVAMCDRVCGETKSGLKSDCGDIAKKGNYACRDMYFELNEEEMLAEPAPIRGTETDWKDEL